MKKVDVNVVILAAAIIISALILLADRPKPETLTEVLSVLASVLILIMGIVGLSDLLNQKK